MLQKILTAVLFVAILGFLVAQRFFSIETPLPTRVTAVHGESLYHIDELLERGQSITTSDEYLSFSIGSDTQIYLAPRTRIELSRTYESELELRFTKGRIVVVADSHTPVTIKTNHTHHRVYQDSASFINYDFLETIHIIPLTGYIQTTIDSTGESLLTPEALSIHETDPVTVETIQVNLLAGDATDFYQWTEIFPDLITQ